MAEPVVSLDQENKLVNNNGPENEEITEEENRENNTSLLAGLNLVLILSFLSLSTEECSNLDENTDQDMQTGDYNHKAKHGSCFQTTRRQISRFPAVERQTSKVHTKIRDFRHCRRF
ncbi:hypothetical protein DH2020_006164 [Rehmannia glutinosa]|uniref:Uncharacterized protein n=1 Tax=Rehmannia glutinosa TaxID=99300 RepID=A0ABR0XI30_REHGL